MKAIPIRKWGHIILTALGSAYLTFVFFSKSLINALIYHNTTAQTSQPVFLYLLCAAGFYALCYTCLHVLACRSRVLFQHSSEKSRLSPKLFWGVTAGVFLLYLGYLIAYYPGGFSEDTSSQWQQAHSMVFNDHHPFFHTFFFVVLTRIWDNYAFMLLVQIAAFACAMGYLVSTMHAWGFKLSVVLPICIVLSLATPTRNILLYFWKDTAMSVFFLFLLSHIFNIALSNGEWLKKPGHWMASAVLLACITLVRHNAVLFTAPLLGLMLVYLHGARRACLKLIAAVLLLVIGVKGPLYSIYNVEPNKDTYLETTGLPMTILCSSYVYSPETMPEEAYQFMERFEDHETAVQRYVLGNYNTIKWFWDMDYAQAEQLMEETPVADFIRMTLETIKGNVTLAARSVLELTAMVWDPIDTQYHLADVPSGLQPNVIPIPESLTQHSAVFFKLVDGVLDGHIFQKLTSQLGVLILVMLLACYVSIHHGRGWACLWLVLPVMCYNFGTMLLLCGPDYRFFHFNCLAAYPLAVLLLSKPRESVNETCKSHESILY